MKDLKKAVLSTLAYADVFDYPFTALEVWRFLIVPSEVKFSDVQKTLTLMSAALGLIHTDDIYYCLGGRQNIIYIRDKRKRWSRKKLQIAKRVAQWLRLIPWIKMVGVSGALALLNSDRDDDIDILIVSGKNRLWLTRLLATFLVELLGQRRQPNDREFRDKICLNMFLDENHLSVPKKERDLFSAHEVCQMRVLWERNGMYKRFLGENRWVKKYLPNTLSTTNIDTKYHEKFSGTSCFYSWLFVFERLVKKLQLWYMRKRRTTEVISEGVIRFHPQDARGWVLKEYSGRLKKLGGLFRPLTTKNFLLK
ncbi:hypothetical protein HY946_01800 [Candidatus Gottesmanbacteria bacterium]|nr:hypothetical protein [Candidatus Gottesmanbacteria bacterium]